jgi:hypothetical protein
MLWCGFVFAQCDNKQISTDPRNPNNTEKPSAKNNLFWFPHNGNNNSQINMRLSGTPSTDIIMNNPYWQAPSNNSFDQYAQRANSDFYPEDGWELVKSDFGYLADGSTLRTSLPSLTYLCLYNRFTGTMRFFGAFPTVPDAYQIINWTVTVLSHKRNTQNPNSNNRNLDATNLLSIQGDAIGALDKQTDEVSFNVLTEFPGVSPGGYFFWFDIPVAYDPCICYNNVAIEMKGILIKEASFIASGTLLGTVQEITTPSSSSYSELIAKKVIGAGISLGTAVATKGTIVQVGPFVDLIDIITNKPGISSSDKKPWEMFQKFLNASDKLTRKDGEWVDWLTKDTLKDKDVAKMMGAINTYVSSVMDINKKGGGGKSVTTVNGKINLTGTVTTQFHITTSPYWAVPGSALSLNCEEEVTNVSGSPEKNPEYPLYNEALGTFALLKTPKLKLNISRVWEYSENQFMWQPDPSNPLQPMKAYWACDGFKIQGYLPEDLFYVFNPKMNLNLDKTKISAMITVEFGESTESWDWELMDENKIPLQFKNSMNYNGIKDKNPINMEYLAASKTLSSIPVDLNDFRELFFQARVITTNYNSFVYPLNPSSEFDIAPDFKPKVFLKLYFEYESNDIGKNNTPVRSTQLISLPFEIETFDGSFPIPKYNLVTTEFINLNQFGGQHFTSNTTIYAETINITSDISVAPGVKVIVRARKKINIEPGVKISPEVILEVQDNPFSSLYPQVPKSGSYLANYCAGQTTDATYKAKEFASTMVMSSVINDSSDNVYKTDNRIEEILIDVIPNPSSKHLRIDWYSSNSKPVRVEFVNASGLAVMSVDYTKSAYDISMFASGLYLVRVTFDDGFVRTKKFVKIE